MFLFNKVVLAVDIKLAFMDWFFYNLVISDNLIIQNQIRIFRLSSIIIIFIIIIIRQAPTAIEFYAKILHTFPT